MQAKRLLQALTTLLAVAAGGAAIAGETEGAPGYVFGWPFVEWEEMQPRGGDTRGPEVDVVERPTEDFRRLQAEGISKFERDRRAILAMAGPYRVSFDFLEVMGFAPDYEPARPYRSWATEYVYVIADEGDFISLQHLLVMRVVDEDGDVRGPFVSKHWRQDWHYEAERVPVYRGARTWRRTPVPEDAREGRWTQTVWGVADTPRYGARGEWRHTGQHSTWESDETWRPLPRREYSVRDDYDALVGRNRHTVLPTGWVHEQRNLKVTVPGPGDIGRRLAKEYGIARYQRIEGYDFSAGGAYLEATGGFWQEVREQWDRLLAERGTLHLKASVEDTRLFEPLFERAQEIADGGEFRAEADRRFIRETIDDYLAGRPSEDGGY